MNSLDSQLFRTLVESDPARGVVICEPRDGDWTVVFVNGVMQQMTGYDAAAFVGRNMRFLQGEDRDQEGLAKIRTALREGSACQTMLRNYRRDGTLFWNEVNVVPLRNANGQLTHFASFHREGGAARGAVAEPRDPAMSTQTMLAYLRDDKLTGLLRRPYLEELIKRDWALAQRESRRVSLLLFDLDYFSQYREVFGRQGSDQSFRRIARVVSGCFRRASDLCGRFDDYQIAAHTSGMEQSQVVKLADTVLARIRDLAIHHPRSSVSRYVTASAGVVSVVPSHDVLPERIYELSQHALTQAQDAGRNQVVTHDV